MKRLLIILCFITPCALADIFVVVHPSNGSSPDKDFVARLFLGKLKQFPDGATAIPLSQADSNPITDTFNNQVLGRNSRQLKAYWSQLVFTGKGTPAKEVTNDAEVIQLVKANPNMIGYVSQAPQDGSVKAIKLD
jgi:ABC-type phosphate transport system substrate-binding protein